MGSENSMRRSLSDAGNKPAIAAVTSWMSKHCNWRRPTAAASPLGK